MSGTRDENVFMARLAEQAERYEDMVTYMTRVANMGSELSLEERNLLSVAFKNAVGAGRSAWRSIASMMQKEDPAVPYMGAVNGYKCKVEAELKAKCEEILALLRKDGGLIATATNPEAQVFYLKMEGDYHRYLAEFSAADQPLHAQNAHDAYSKASGLAGALPPTHPIRLGLALIFSVFYFEVYGKAAEACTLAKASFEAAVEELQSLPEEQARDSQAILQLLRDNLILWQSDMNAGAGGDKPPEQDGTQCEDL
jgi:14-3-3 protein epsilon